MIIQRKTGYVGPVEQITRVLVIIQRNDRLCGSSGTDKEGT